MTDYNVTVGKAQIDELTSKMNHYVSIIYTTIIGTDYTKSLMTNCENELNTLILACEPFASTDANKELLSKWVTAHTHMLLRVKWV